LWAYRYRIAAVVREWAQKGGFASDKMPSTRRPLNKALADVAQLSRSRSRSATSTEELDS
jgi:hypothetical protein